MEEVIVLSKRHYDFADKETGRQVVGFTVEYLTQYLDEQTDFVGVSPLKVAATPEVFANLSAVPGRYRLDFQQRPGAKGKPALTITVAECIERLDASLRPVAVPVGVTSAPSAPISAKGAMSLEPVLSNGR